jgi:flagellar protein FliL
MSDKKAEEAPKKKGGMMKIVLLLVGVLVLVGGGVGGTLFAMGMVGGGKHGAAEEPEGPRLVPKAEQKRVSASGEGGEHGGGATAAHKPPTGSGGDKYASNYYPMDKEFTSNLKDSIHFIQVGIAISTPYDDTVIENIKTNEIAVRSSILLALGDTTEEQVFTSAGKEQLQRRVTKAINDTLKQKEGFGGVGNTYFTSFVVQ